MTSQQTDNENKRLWRIGGVAAGVIAAAATLYKSADQIDTGSEGIVINFGRVARVVDAGLSFHWPWQSVHRMNLQSQTVDIPLEVYSKDAQLAPQNVLSVTFSLPSSDVVEVFTKYGEDYFNAVLKAPIENIFREAFGHRTADQIIADREALNKEVSERLEKEFDTRGLHFERLGISIKFNDSFNRSAEESAIARTKVNTAEQDLRRKQIEADQAIVEAKGQADAEFARTSKQAEGKAVLGEAEAKVLELKSAVIERNPELVRLLAAERWDGKLPTTMIPGQATPLVDVSFKSEQK